MLKKGDTCGSLTLRWSWETLSGKRIWKCTCECGNICYVKEEAIKSHIVVDCGCGIWFDPPSQAESLLHKNNYDNVEIST